MEKLQKIDLIMALLNGMKPREASEILDECEQEIRKHLKYFLADNHIPEVVNGMRPDEARETIGTFIAHNATVKIVYEKDIARALNEDAKDLDATTDGVARRMLDCILQVCPPSSEK